MAKGEVEFEAVFPEMRLKDKLLDPQSGVVKEVAIFSLEVPTTSESMRNLLANLRGKSVKITMKLTQLEL